jgi:NAD(P)H-hydrate epimerase
VNFATALLDVRTMGEADRLTLASGVSEVELMNNAGAAVVEAIRARLPTGEAVVLCGPGSNGGDGFVVARRLAQAGWQVRVALLGSQGNLKGAAAYHASHWPGAINALGPNVLEGASLVVDALFGSGLSRALTGPAAETLAAAAKGAAPIVAVDVPSGVMGDTGEALGAARCALTVTYLRKKPGHVLLPGRTFCGAVVVADIGAPPGLVERLGPVLFENDPRLWRAQLPRPEDGGNKYGRGHVLINGGYPMTGAARMAARAAARIGAGLTTIAVPLVALPIYAAALQSVMVAPLSGPQDLDLLLEDHRLTAFLIGPGAGNSDQTRERVYAFLRTSRPVVLDADALNVFQTAPTELDKAIVGPCVLTPHEGEFRRLFDDTGDKLSRARAAARRCGAILVLKGADTVIAAPDGRAIINSDAPASLATAGAGDVLSGMVVGLLAQGMKPFLAAAAAVWMHGAAARIFGPGLLAEDLPDLIPQVLRDLAPDRLDLAPGIDPPPRAFLTERHSQPPKETLPC